VKIFNSDLVVVCDHVEVGHFEPDHSFDIEADNTLIVRNGRGHVVQKFAPHEWHVAGIDVPSTCGGPADKTFDHCQRGCAPDTSAKAGPQLTHGPS